MKEEVAAGNERVKDIFHEIKRIKETKEITWVLRGNADSVHIVELQFIINDCDRRKETTC